MGQSTGSHYKCYSDIRTLNVPFRCHKENIDQPNSENVLAITDFLSKYNPLLQDIISAPKKRKYISPKFKMNSFSF